MLIEIEGASVRYIGRKDPALEHLTLRFNAGETALLLGASGCGKSTLALTLNGLIPYSVGVAMSGRIVVDGLDTQQAAVAELAQHLMGILPAPRQTVFIEGQDVRDIPSPQLIERAGYVFQNPEHQFVTDSVFDEVAYGLRVKGLSAREVEARTNAMLERFGLLRLAKANPFTLSHGQKRRLSVAMMLAVGQRTLILDEPTFGQDQRNAKALMELLRDLHREGRTVIIITHDMALVAEHAERVAVMSAGKLLFDGGVHVLFARPELLRQARLTPPPIAQLAKRVPALRDALTLEEAVGLLSSVIGHASLANDE